MTSRALCSRSFKQFIVHHSFKVKFFLEFRHASITTFANVGITLETDEVVICRLKEVQSFSTL
jgi:hypothetical protein